MPRLARVVIPDVSLHVVQRGHNRRDCFFAEDDHLAYLAYLREFAGRFDCSIHAYCLMTNHVHLFMTPHAPEACALVMKYTGQYYVSRINKRLERSGTLWEGRFYSCLVTSEAYALACYRYIELNPVEAGMVQHARDYRWSSYSKNVVGSTDDFLIPHAAYAALGSETATRTNAYAALLDQPLERSVIDEIRKATRGGYVVGSRRKPRGRPRAPVMRKIGSVPI
jgi:putative transposase